LSLIDAALNRSRTVIATLILLLVAGYVAYRDIPKESDPDINIPIIYVSMSHEGISPEDAERLLARPMESELRAIEGIKELRADAFEGGANVILEFDAGFDADSALADVREKVDLVKPELPEDSDEPTVHEVNLSLFPIIVVTLSGELTERAVLKIARDLKDDITGIPTVLDVKITGDREEVVEIIIDPLLFESYGLEPPTVLSLVTRSNLLVAAGALDTGRGRFSIKVPGLFETAADILDMPLKVDGDAVVKIRDIAVVKRTFKDARTYARVDGRSALALEVSKRTGENIIDTITNVKAIVDASRGEWPEGLEVAYSQDRSTNIRRMLSDLQNNVIAAVLLVMIVVVAVLGVRTGLLVGIAIPGSFLTGILVLAAAGLTVNIVVLFSLILAVGLLVDGAIVVTEYADRRMTEGLKPRDAYALAAKHMAWPIIASTATTLAAFLPLIFWPGVVGEFMKFLPITLIATLCASLLMALIFVPTVGAYVGRPVSSGSKATKKIASDSADALDHVGGFVGVYVKVLKAALRYPSLVLAIAVATLFGSWFAYGTFGRGVEFFPDVEPEQAIVQVHARGNLSTNEMDALVADVERQVLNIGRERGELKTVYSASGLLDNRSSNAAEDVIGSIRLEFVEWDKRRPAREIYAEIRERVAHLAGIIVEVTQPEAGPPVGKPVHLQLSARDPELLTDAVNQARTFFDNLSGLKNIEDSQPVPGIEWELSVDRAQAARFGADVAVTGSFIQLITKGLKVSAFRPDDADEEIDIIARFPFGSRTIDKLDQIKISTPQGLIPIGNYVTRTAKPKTGLLRRVDAKRIGFVLADVEDGVLPDNKVKEIKAWLETADINPAIEIAFKGEDEEQKAAQEFLTKAFGIALFIMALILVTQFNSFYSGFLILSAVIMSTVGVMLGLLVIQQPFGIVMSGVGVIALAGIVVNNNIVLIDTYDRIRKSVSNPATAILLTGAQRLRPVLLTSVTTILGLMPMVLGINIDFVTRKISIGGPSTQWWTQLSTAIAFGLAFATILTLIVTPSALMLKSNAAKWLSHRRDLREVLARPAE